MEACIALIVDSSIPIYRFSKTRGGFSGFEGSFLRVVIVGAGKIGGHLAKRLSQARNEVVVIDRDEKKTEQLSGEVDALVISADITRLETFRKAEIENADVLVAVTDRDEVNLLACLIAREVGIPRCVARVADPELESTFERLGVEEAICPEVVTANLIEELVRHPHGVAELLTTEEGDTKLMEIRVLANSEADGKRLGELHLPADVLVLALRRRESFTVPDPETVFQENDRVIVLSPAEALDRVNRVFRG